MTSRQRKDGGQPDDIDPQAFDELREEYGELLDTLVPVFIEQGEQAVAEMRVAIAGNDGHALAASAHRLKGSAATFAAARVSELGARLEDHGREGRLNRAVKLLDELEQAMERTGALLLSRAPAP